MVETVTTDTGLVLASFDGATERTLASKLEDTVNAADFVDAALAPAIYTTRDSSVDCSADLQAFVDYCRTNWRKGIIRAGYYKISSTIFLTYAAFQGVWIEGEGGGYDLSSGTAGTSGATIIDASAILDAPAVAIQSARGFYFGKVGIVGPNVAPWTRTAVNLLPPSKTEALYLTEGVRNERYSPQCGICVDPLSGTDPGSGQGYSGIGEYAGTNSGTAYGRIEDVNLWHHNVAMMISPSYDGQQGDRISIVRPYITGANYGIASGQAQTRGVHILDPNLEHVRVGFDEKTFGQQQGVIAEITSLQAIATDQLVNLQGAFTPHAISITRVETIKTLGVIGSGFSPVVMPWSISGDVSLGNGSTYKSAPIMLENAGPGAFRTCSLLNTSVSDIFNVCGNNASISVLDTTLGVSGVDVARVMLGMAQDYTSQQSVAVANARLVRATGQYSYADAAPRKFSLPVRVMATYFTSEVKDRNNTYKYVHGNDNTYVISAISDVVVDKEAGTVEFTAATPADFIVDCTTVFWQCEARSGSMYVVPALEVTAKDGSTITCSMPFDHDDYDDTYDPDYALIFVEEWAPGVELTGDVESGTPTISNVSPTTVVKNGDFIKGTNIPANARVVSGAGTAALTLNKNATGTASGVSLYFGRLHTYTTSAAF